MSAQKRGGSGRKRRGQRPGDKKCRMAFDMSSAARISRSSVAPRSRPGRTGASGRPAQKMAAGLDQQRQHDVEQRRRTERPCASPECGRPTNAAARAAQARPGARRRAALPGAGDSDFQFLAGRLCCFSMLRRLPAGLAAERANRNVHSMRAIRVKASKPSRRLPPWCVVITELESTRSCQPSVVSYTSDWSSRGRRDG